MATTRRFDFRALAPDYARLWATMEIRPGWRRAAAEGAARIAGARARYEGVGGPAGVPWFVIGLLHLMESGGRFTRHLHNGDPLAARTVNVPAGRPRRGTPPFTWQESAADAIAMKRLGEIEAWTAERLAFEFERFNGFGYRTRARPPIPSPYLWSGSNHYAKGKFVRDGVYDPNALSWQAGAMVLLRALIEGHGVRLEAADPD